MIETSDKEIEPLSPNDIELWRTLEDELGADALLTRIPRVAGLDMEGRPFLVPWHTRPLADLFARIRRGERVRACVGMPPRHGKTEGLLGGVAWLWERRPLDVMYITYAADFAEEKSVRARQIATNTGWKVEGTRKFWKVQNGGSFRAGGIEGQWTGHGAHLIIVDDPFKNRHEAESPRMRDNVHDFVKGTALDRAPNGSAIILHHRWHDDDLIGRLLDTGRWEDVRLPAISKEGRALWPERFSLDLLLDIQTEKGPYDWASLYQQEPQPKGGRLFGEPGRYSWPAPVGNSKFILAACDPAATAKNYADRSSIMVGAFYATADHVLMDVLDHWADHVEIPELAQRLRWTAEHWGCPVVIETIGAFKGVAQVLRRIAPGIKVHEIPSVPDKFSRSQHAAAAWSAGRIRVPSDSTHAPWLPDLMREVRLFTGIGDAHDDRVDSLVHLWNSGYASMVRLTRPQRREHPLASVL